MSRARWFLVRILMFTSAFFWLLSAVFGYLAMSMSSAARETLEEGDPDIWSRHYNRRCHTELTHNDRP